MTYDPKRPHGPVRHPAPPETIRGVRIEASCEFCGTCLALCPDVFVFTPDGIEVVATADLQQQSEAIVAAAEACPLLAIRLS